MRIVFFGSGEFGLPTLRALREAHEVALVVTQPDRPAGRDRQFTPTPVACWAVEQNLPLLKPERVNDPGVVQQILVAKPEANVVVAFGQKIGDTIIASPHYGRAATMNLHASLLPKYRGAAPIHWAVLRGETETGNTVFSLVERMDAGDILGMQTVPLAPLDTTGDLHDRLAEMGSGLVLDVLQKLATGTLQPRAQDESQATLAPKLGRGDAVIDFAQRAEEIRRRVHGLTPWPGVTVHYAPPGSPRREPLKLLRVETVSRGTGEPGVLEGEVIATGQGGLRPLEVQPPGKRAMSWSDFLRGNPMDRGTRFSGGK